MLTYLALLGRKRGQVGLVPEGEHSVRNPNWRTASFAAHDLADAAHLFAGLQALKAQALDHDV